MDIFRLIPLADVTEPSILLKMGLLDKKGRATDPLIVPKNARDERLRKRNRDRGLTDDPGNNQFSFKLKN